MGKCCTALRATLTSIYFWACLIYCVYVYQILAVNYCETKYPSSPIVFFNDTNTTDSYDAPGYDYDYILAPECRGKGDTPVNRQFIAASSVHVLNGVMFGLVWVPYFLAHPDLSRKFKFCLLIPEMLNIIEASLYISSASLYGEAALTCGDYSCDLYMEVHNRETAASILEMIASFGWLWSWYVSYSHGIGRGVTIWDPDFLGAVGLILPSIIYVLYNIQVLANPESFGTNNLYFVADCMYFVDAP